MTDDKKHCPKCHAEMEQGFVPDHSHATTLVGSWHAGPPKKSFWGRISAPWTEGTPIGAFRCQRCGFLEFYADFRFAAK